MIDSDESIISVLTFSIFALPGLQRTVLVRNQEDATAETI